MGDPGGRPVRGVGLKPFACCVDEFEARWWHGYSLVCAVCCVGGGLCHKLITRWEESYLLCVCVCVIVCDLETSTMRRPRPELEYRVWVNIYVYIYTLMTNLPKAWWWPACRVETCSPLAQPYTIKVVVLDVPIFHLTVYIYILLIYFNF